MDSTVLGTLYREHVADLVRRTTAVLGAHELDALVVHAGRPKKRTSFDDQYFPLRPTPHLQHWVPLAEPDVLVVLRAGHDRPTLLWPDAADFWERPGVPEITRYVALDAVFDLLRPTHDVAAAARELVAGLGRVAFVGDDAEAAAELGLEAAVASPALLAALDALRVTKTVYEIECLAQANVRAARGHEALREAFRAGAHSELDLHLAFLAATEQDDPETPYKNIVAKGANAATLHHVSYGRDRVASESLLVDAGATFLGYCSDITRTWVTPRSAAGQTFLGLTEGLELAQRRLTAAARGGKPYEELHDLSHVEVGTLLRDAKVVRGSVGEAVERGVTRAFYPHGLGHSLGLQCHDVGCATTAPRADNPFLRNTATLGPGHAFTIEPGLYFIDKLLAKLRAEDAGKLVDWGLVDALRPFGGIRIEDDLTVDASGAPRNLTRELLPRGGGAP